MGTDIYIFAEQKQIDGSWRLFDPPVEETCSDGESVFFQPNCFYDGRNYALFSILADVRNGGATEEPFIPIDDLRGVPSDMSSIATACYYQECQSPTWYFIEELLNFDWDQTAQFAQYVDKEHAYLFEGNPLGYPYEEMQKLQNPDAQPGEATITSTSSGYSVDGVKVRWRQTYGECAKYFIPAIKRFKSAELKSVRVVMWFDS